MPPNKPREEPLVPESPKPAPGPGISPEARVGNLDALKERERISRLQEEHLGDFLIKMKTTDEAERARLREKLAELTDIERLRISGVTVQENNADYHLKHLKLASSYLEISEPAQNQNGHVEFVVDFQGNENAEWKVGAGHCLPPEISVIAVFDEHGDPVTPRAIRMIKDGRIGYFDEKTGEYAHIHTGFRIEVLETGGSTEEKVATRILEEKEFFEKDAKKFELKKELAEFFDAKGVAVVIDDIYFERNLALNIDFEKFFPEGSINLVANFNLAGVKDLTLSDLPELLKNPNLKALQEKRYARKEELPIDINEYIVPREIDPNEPFVETKDSSGNKVTLRKTAARMFNRAVRIATARGIEIRIASSFRDYHDQERVLGKSIVKRGFHDHRFVATPGHSPHHTGGAIDVYAFRDGKPDQSLLKEILPLCGFENYQAEDWHWEFGTDRWRRQRAGARGQVYAKILERSDIVHA